MADKIAMAMEDAAFRDYLKDCDEHSIQPDTASAFHFAWQAARALAQGEPGEAPDGRLHADGYFTWNTGKRPNYRADLKLPCDFYLSPTASAPAAERETRDLEIEGVVSWLRSHDLLEEADKVQRLCGIGTKEPTNG